MSLDLRFKPERESGIARSRSRREDKSISQTEALCMGESCRARADLDENSVPASKCQAFGLCAWCWTRLADAENRLASFVADGRFSFGLGLIWNNMFLQEHGSSSSIPLHAIRTTIEVPNGHLETFPRAPFYTWWPLSKCCLPAKLHVYPRLHRPWSRLWSLPMSVVGGGQESLHHFVSQTPSNIRHDVSSMIDAHNHSRVHSR